LISVNIDLLSILCIFRNKPVHPGKQKWSRLFYQDFPSGIFRVFFLEKLLSPARSDANRKPEPVRGLAYPGEGWLMEKKVKIPGPRPSMISRTRDKSGENRHPGTQRPGSARGEKIVRIPGEFLRIISFIAQSIVYTVPDAGGDIIG
jgi:hypothetical protein